MKKFPVMLLAFSLLANAVLAFVLMCPPAASKTAKSAPAVRVAQTRAQTLTAADSAILKALETGGHDALLGRLRALGVPELSAHAIATGFELQKAGEELDRLHAETPYWRNYASLPAETRAKIAHIGSTLTSRFAELLPQFRRERHEFLSPERRVQLRRLEQDYDDLRAEVHTGSQGFMLKADFDNLNLFIKERRREIDGFFTPDELALRDARHSPMAQLIKEEYGNVIGSESEYMTIYSIMNSAGSDDAGRARVEALLGPDRMAQLTRLNDPDYNLIRTASTRLDLPLDATMTALTQIRTQAWQTSADIIADTTLASAQRKAMLRELAVQSREQMAAVLGPEGADAFAKSARWMYHLRSGSGFTVDSKGRMRIKTK